MILIFQIRNTKNKTHKKCYRNFIWGPWVNFTKKVFKWCLKHQKHWCFSIWCINYYFFKFKFWCLSIQNWYFRNQFLCLKHQNWLMKLTFWFLVVGAPIVLYEIDPQIVWYLTTIFNIEPTANYKVSWEVHNPPY